ncbi:MAG: DUF167 family protein [Hyphomicrobiales bacterium]|nr:DUF167 family protein [Hyphomicrobiales bacterium]
MNDNIRTSDGEPFAAHAHGVTLAVRLTPKSSRDAIEGIEVGADGRSCVKARVRALPSEGAANDALTRLVAKWIGVPRREVSILSGATSRSKILLVRGDAKELAEKIRGLLVSARSA